MHYCGQGDMSIDMHEPRQPYYLPVHVAPLGIWKICRAWLLEVIGAWSHLGTPAGPLVRI